MSCWLMTATGVVLVARVKAVLKLSLLAAFEAALWELVWCWHVFGGVMVTWWDLMKRVLIWLLWSSWRRLVMQALMDSECDCLGLKIRYSL